MQLGMIEDSYLPGPLQCFCGHRLEKTGTGRRGKRRPWHCLMYFTHTGKDGFFSGSESLDLCSPLTPDSDTSLTRGVLLGEAAFVNDTTLYLSSLLCMWDDWAAQPQVSLSSPSPLWAFDARVTRDMMSFKAYVIEFFFYLTFYSLSGPGVRLQSLMIILVGS